MTEQDVITRTASLLNKAEFKRWIVRLAQDEKFYWRQYGDTVRVSSQTIADAEEALKSWARNHVSKLPSKGKTI